MTRDYVKSLVSHIPCHIYTSLINHMHILFVTDYFVRQSFWSRNTHLSKPPSCIVGDVTSSFPFINDNLYQITTHWLVMDILWKDMMTGRLFFSYHFPIWYNCTNNFCGCMYVTGNMWNQGFHVIPGHFRDFMKFLTQCHNKIHFAL